jgi:hypothetical protein
MYCIYNLNDEASVTEVSENFFKSSHIINTFYENAADDHKKTFSKMIEISKKNLNKSCSSNMFPSLEQSYDYFTPPKKCYSKIKTYSNAFPLPRDYYAQTVIKFVDSFINNSICEINDTFILTKMISLMIFLDINVCIENLFQRLITRLETIYENINDDNLEIYFDCKFKNNCDLISKLWYMIVKKQNQAFKMFFTISKFNYPPLNLNLESMYFINQENLNECCQKLKDQITSVHVSGRMDINNLNIFVNLTELYASSTYKHISADPWSDDESFEEQCGVGDKGIIKCVNLRELHINGNHLITDLNHLTKLEILETYDDQKINNILDPNEWKYNNNDHYYHKISGTVNEL